MIVATHQIQQPAIAAKDSKLATAAHEFEGMMLQEMLKGLNFGDSPDAASESSGGATESIRTFGTEAMAKAIAAHGGFGLANQIIQQVTREVHGKAPTP